MDAIQRGVEFMQNMARDNGEDGSHRENGKEAPSDV